MEDDEVGEIVIVENYAALISIDYNGLSFRQPMGVYVMVDCAVSPPTLSLTFEYESLEDNGWHVKLDACPDLQRLPDSIMVSLEFFKTMLRQRPGGDVVGDVFACVLARLVHVEFSRRENGEVAILLMLNDFEANGTMPSEVAADFFDSESDADSADDDEGNGRDVDETDEDEGDGEEEEV